MEGDVADDASDLQRLVSLASHRPSVRKRPAAVTDSPASAPDIVMPTGSASSVAPPGPDDEDLGTLVAIASAGPSRRKYQKSSWEGARHARDEREKQVVRRKLDRANARTSHLEDKIVEVTAALPAVAKFMGVKAARAAVDEKRANILCKLAMAPTIKCDRVLADRQNQSAHVFAQAAMDIQYDCRDT
eukprot:9499369-Pyramimonas_sp.AAC.1